MIFKSSTYYLYLRQWQYSPYVGCPPYSVCPRWPSCTSSGASTSFDGTAAAYRRWAVFNRPFTIDIEAATPVHSHVFAWLVQIININTGDAILVVTGNRPALFPSSGLPFPGNKRLHLHQLKVIDERRLQPGADMTSNYPDANHHVNNNIQIWSINDKIEDMFARPRIARHAISRENKVQLACLNIWSVNNKIDDVHDLVQDHKILMYWCYAKHGCVTINWLTRI